MHTDEERQFWMVQTGELLSALSTGDALLQQQKTEQSHFMDLLNCILLPRYCKVFERLDKLKSDRYGRDLRGLFLEMAKKRFEPLHQFLPLRITTDSDLLRLVRNANAHAQVHFSSDPLDKSWSSVIREVFNEDYPVVDNEVFLYNRRSNGLVDMILWCPVESLIDVLSEVVQGWKELLYAVVGETVVSPPLYHAPSSEETRRRRAWRAKSIARMSAARECKIMEEKYLKACEKNSIDLLTAAKEALTAAKERAFTASSKEVEHGDAAAEVEYDLFDD